MAKDKFSISIKAIYYLILNALQSNRNLNCEIIEFLKTWIVLLIEENNIEHN